MRLGHSALMRKALEKEKLTQNEMIQSLMPEKVALEVMQGSHDGDDDGEEADDVGSGGGEDAYNGSIAMTSAGRRGGKKSDKKRRAAKKRGSSTADDTFSFSEEAEEYSLSEQEPLRGQPKAIVGGMS